MRNITESLNRPDAIRNQMEESTALPPECQIPRLALISEGYAKVEPRPLGVRLRVMIIRHLNPGVKRAIKTYSNHLINWFSRLTDGSNESLTPPTHSATTNLKAGDLVRVRSREEIQATLNRWGGLKGCSFMPEMWPYCSTTQRVLKPMERFLDERDYRVKKCTGIILLEGAICQGTALFGRCDRSCFFFWREEWLDKVD